MPPIILQPTTILQLIAQLGIPLAVKVFNIVTTHFEANAKPTAEMWKALLDAEDQSHKDFIAGLKS